jgi:hypothetical protein
VIGRRFVFAPVARLGVGRGLGALAMCLCMALAETTTVLACPVCSIGDPTLTAIGTEAPSQGRFRASIDLGHRTDTVGTPYVDELHLSEQRLSLQSSWAVTDWMVLLTTMPFVRRRVRYANYSEMDVWGVGDLQFRAKMFVYQDRRFRPRHLVSLLAGISLPTAPLERNQGGDFLPMELQPGTGSVMPLTGAMYTYFRFPWSAYVTAQLNIPTVNPEDFRASTSLKTTTAVQYQLTQELALRPGIDTRYDTPATQAGVNEPDSGGFIAFASMEVLVSLTMEWMMYGAARIPVINALWGRHEEGPVLSLGVAYDF